MEVLYIRIIIAVFFSSIIITTVILNIILEHKYLNLFGKIIVYTPVVNIITILILITKIIRNKLINKN